MQRAIPAHDYSADERAERARGAAIAFLGMAALAAVSLAAAIALLLAG
jgi:hypothetical protein